FDFQPSRDLHPSPTLTSGSVWTSHLIRQLWADEV
ncbi:MAG: hypothetical protein ACI8UO_003718, partial [Verrucomicrobiales bacterium]